MKVEEKEGWMDEKKNNGSEKQKRRKNANEGTKNREREQEKEKEKEVMREWDNVEERC